MKKIISFILIIILLMLPIIIDVNILCLTHYQTEKNIIVFIVKPNEEFTVKWIHSVELTPWEEIFKIDDNYNMILDRTRFQQFGAGVPDSAGTDSYIIDGYIVFSGINRKIDLLPYGISSFAKHTFVFRDKEYKLFEIVPDGDRININTARVSFYKYLIMKYL